MALLLEKLSGELAKLCPSLIFFKSKYREYWITLSMVFRNLAIVVPISNIYLVAMNSIRYYILN